MRCSQFERDKLFKKGAQFNNHERPHSGKYCYGKTPYQTLLESKHIANEKTIGEKRIQVDQI